MGNSSRWVRLAGGLMTAIVAAALFAPAASGKFRTFQAGNLTFRMSLGVIPNKLPRKRMAPAGLKISGRVASSDGTHIPELRQAVVDLDRNISINARGLPVCSQRVLQRRTPKELPRACRKAHVGQGNGTMEALALGGRVISVPVGINLYNGGVRRGTTTLLIQAVTRDRNPFIGSNPVIGISIVKVHRNRRVNRFVWNFPHFGTGQSYCCADISSFDLNLKRTFFQGGKQRSYVSARCRRNRFEANIVKALFRRNEPPKAHTVAAVLAGKVVWPCRST